MVKRTAVAIFGYGTVALTIAAILSQNGITVNLVNTSPNFTKQKINRLIALSTSSVDFLKKYRLIEDFNAIGQSINKIVVSQYKAIETLEFSAQEIDQENFGYMVYEDTLWEALHSHINTSNNIHVLNAEKHNISIQQDCISLGSGIVLTPELTIIADGKNSLLRQMYNFPIQQKDYHQIAIVLNIQHTMPHLGIAREFFMPNGPFATLPTHNPYQSSVVWTEKKETFEFFNKVDPALFATLLQERCSVALGVVTHISESSIFPLTLLRATTPIKHRVALAGDALHSIHPLAGQGLNLGLRDASSLTELIINHYNLGLDLGSDTLLTSYEKSRMYDIATLVNTMDVINNIYSSTFNFIGQSAIKLINAQPVLKKLLMIYATGQHI